MTEATWNENTTCARCGGSLDDGFESNHLGVRFCRGCFEDGVRDKMAERIARPPELTESCGRCDGALINGCHQNYMGVYFCTSCFERTHSPDGYPREPQGDAEPVAAPPARRRRDDIDEGELSANWMEGEEEEPIYLHDVFLVTTLFALVLYAVAQLSGSLFALSGF